MKEEEVKLGSIIHTQNIDSSTASSGEECDSGNQSEIKLKKKLNLFRFIKSDNSHIRLLSCLIIIRSLNQVDYLMNVYEILRTDLNDESIKKLFLYYNGVWVLLKWCKLANKVKQIGCKIEVKFN